MCKSQLLSYKPAINNWELKFKTQYQKKPKTKKTPQKHDTIYSSIPKIKYFGMSLTKYIRSI